MSSRLIVAAAMVSAAAWTITGSARDPARQAPTAISQQPRTALEAFALRLPPAERQDVSVLYNLGGWVPLWVDVNGHPTAQAGTAQSLLAAAADDGLDPLDYDTATLARLTGILRGTARSESRIAEFDVALSASVLRYLRHLHLGRIDPRSLGLQLTVPSDGHDFAEILHDAIQRGTLRAAAADLMPRLGQYRTLKMALARYRSLAAEPAVQKPIVFERTALKPGDVFSDVESLYRLLVTVGDLSADTTIPPQGLYAGEIVQGVRRFQERHSLDADGVIGRATEQALGVPIAWRVRQIELALERLRWLPDLNSGRLVAVNIPMFRLWAWDASRPRESPILSMAVIVGRALNTRTPVFSERMTHVIFRPYWNVPRSILRSESLPAIARDPGYLARQNMEIVQGERDDSPVLPHTAENIRLLAEGGARLRQRPGPSNALGLVKFMFPNENDVYLHSTPTPQLFKRARRDFSHGCIRVEDPVALAEWVLQSTPGWTRTRIEAAMDGGPSRRVDLPAPVQVIIFYTTAVVRPEDGSMHFVEDLYGQDGALDRAMR